MRKLITGYLVVFVLLMGTLVGLQLVQTEQGGEIRKQAAGVNGGAELNFNTLTNAQRILVPGKESVIIPISMATNQHRVTAADITIAASGNLLNVTAVTNAGYFNPPVIEGPYGTLNTIVLIVTPVAGRIAVGAPCDQCYLGPSPIPTPGSPTIRPCNGPTPMCYPKAAQQNGIVANFTVSAKAGVVGRSELSFVPRNEAAAQPTPPGTAVAGINSSGVYLDTDIIGSSTFTQRYGICVAYDFDKNGTTNVTDIARVSTIFNKRTGDTGFNVLYDSNNDGVITVTDIAVVSTRFNTSCTP